MVGTKTLVGSGCLVIILISVGFMALLRSCLSEYDERSAELPSVIYADDSVAVIVSLVGYDEATSYSSGRGFTTKTVNTTYHLQTNDISTAQKISQAEIKEHSKIKQWPIRIMGTSPSAVWLYVGEIMAYHPRTLQKITDVATLEKKNPLLKDKFPKEYRFYRFDKIDRNIYFTATDGVNWKLDTRTYIANPVVDIKTNDPLEQALDSIDALQTKNRLKQDSLFRLHRRPAAGDYRDQKAWLENYQVAQKQLMQQRSLLDQEAEQLRKAQSAVRAQKQARDERKMAVSTLERINAGYTQMGTNIDTSAETWIGIYNAKEIEKLAPRVYSRRVYDEIARRFIITGKMIAGRNDERLLDLENVNLFKETEFLDGSFLLDKETAEPFRLKNGRYLVIHKDKIGNDGLIRLSAINTSGKTLWTIETKLKSFYDWQLYKDHLVIFGADNPELSVDDANVLMSVNINNGQVSRYDYFTDRK